MTYVYTQSDSENYNFSPVQLMKLIVGHPSIKRCNVNMARTPSQVSVKEASAKHT